MMVMISTAQLLPFVERAIRDTYAIPPSNLVLGQKYLTRSQDDWELSVEFDAAGVHHCVDIVLDPLTGKVLKASEI